MARYNGLLDFPQFADAVWVLDDQKQSVSPRTIKYIQYRQRVYFVIMSDYP